MRDSIFPELAGRSCQKWTWSAALELGITSGAVHWRHSVAKMKASAAKHLSVCFCREICTGVFRSNGEKVIRSTRVTRFGGRTHNCAVSVEFNQVLTVPERLWWCGCLCSGSDVYTALTWDSAGFVTGVLVSITADCTEVKGGAAHRRERCSSGAAWAEWRWMMWGNAAVFACAVVVCFQSSSTFARGAPINTCGNCSVWPTVLLLCWLMKICSSPVIKMKGSSAEAALQLLCLDRGN